MRLVDSSGDTRMGWGEMWKWLHRIKGIVATVKVKHLTRTPTRTLTLTLALILTPIQSLTYPQPYSVTQTF